MFQIKNDMSKMTMKQKQSAIKRNNSTIHVNGVNSQILVKWK